MRATQTQALRNGNSKVLSYFCMPYGKGALLATSGMEAALSLSPAKATGEVKAVAGVPSTGH